MASTLCGLCAQYGSLAGPAAAVDTVLPAAEGSRTIGAVGVCMPVHSVSHHCQGC